MNILIDGQTLHIPEINRGIGTYFKEMIEAMLRNDFVNTFYITVDDEEKLSCFSPFAQNKLIILVNTSFNPTSLLNLDREVAKSKYSNLISLYSKNNEIDVYWNPNPQMDNTILPIRNINIKYVATIYDLIPYVMKDIYFSSWPEIIQKEYLDKIKILKDYDHLFPISNSTKEDITKILDISDTKQTVTFCGVNKKFKPYPFPKIVTDEQYILYLGGFDPRKNMFKAIDAFALFMKEYNSERIAYKLYLVCIIGEEAKYELISYAKKKRIKKNLVLTGFLSKKELLKIYQKAQCFFFPSLYEGFGLPILEALSSGLPVACADNSSLPEVAKEFAHYFNANDINAMAISLKKALKEGMNLESRLKRHFYASVYTWENPANILLSKILSFQKKEAISKSKKIAWVSPFPPQRSGISNYSKILLLAMKDDIEVDIYYDNIKPEKELIDIFRAFPLKKLANNFNDYDEVIYHLGNNSEFHTNIYKYAWNYPSTVVIHDWNMHPFMQHSFLNSKDSVYYDDAMKVYGEEGDKELELTHKRGYPNIERFPMSDAIVKKSKRVIVHHQWVKEQFINKSNVEVIPLFSHIEETPVKNDIINFKNNYHISKNEYIISVFGEINSNKLPEVIIESIKTLLDNGYPIKLIFAGKIQKDTQYLFNLLEETIYKENIIATDYLEKNKYFSCLYASDLIINLRNPSMGEASLTLTEALYAGKAVIIGDLNQYKEFPDEMLAGKIIYNGNEVSKIVDIIKNTLENKVKKERVQEHAKNYSNNVLSLDKVIKSYLELKI
jgi:glycosyltransferase involved in cell wall biosynthesis